MSAINLYFHIHHPYKVGRYQYFDVGRKKGYFCDDSEADYNNDYFLEKMVTNVYSPFLTTMEKALAAHPEFKFSLSITGVMLEQLEQNHPVIIGKLRKLVSTGRVEILSETYYHSLAFLYSEEEFVQQVSLHNHKIQQLFGIRPTIFRNTELIFNSDLGKLIEQMGFKAVLTDLGTTSDLNQGEIHLVQGTSNLKLISNNPEASRLIQKSMTHKTSFIDLEKSLKQLSKEMETINISIDLQAVDLKSHQLKEFFRNLSKLPDRLKMNFANFFVTNQEALEIIPASAEVEIPHYISWSELKGELTGWRSNSMQIEALAKLYELREQILKSGDHELISDWRRLQASDHFYYMCTTAYNNSDSHYFSPYDSPYEAFINFMNVIEDIKHRLGIRESQSPQEVEVESNVNSLTAASA